MTENKKKIIPIFFATDNNYMPFCGVSITSIKKLASEDYQYRIYVLYTNLDMDKRIRLERLAENNIEIKCVDVADEVRGLNLNGINHISVESTYRLLITKLFPQYPKVLYLDCDIAILDDVSKLYNYDLEDHIVGAVLGRLFEWSRKYIEEELKLDIDGYFNAGILLINTEQFEKNKIRDRCLEMLTSGIRYWTLDQDVLNITCAGHVAYLDNRWNFEWEHIVKGFEKGISAVNDGVRQGTLEIPSDPGIIHYTSGIKPWYHPDQILSEHFWKNARNSVFYEEILVKLMEFNMNQREAAFKRFMFPFNKIPRGAKVALYGAGEVGQAFVKQLKITNYCEVIIWVDKNYEKLNNSQEISVKAVEDLDLKKWDFIVIAIENEKIEAEIRNMLIEKMFSDEKIIWQKP